MIQKKNTKINVNFGVINFLTLDGRCCVILKILFGKIEFDAFDFFTL